MMSCVNRSLEAEFIGHYSYALRASTLTFSLLIGLFVPYFFEFLSIVGSSLSVIVCVVIPLSCHWALARQNGLEKLTNLRLTVAKHALISVVGLVALIIGTTNGV